MYKILAAYYVKYSHIKEFIEWSSTEYVGFYWANFKFSELSTSDVVDDFEEFYSNNYAIISVEYDSDKYYASEHYIKYADYAINWLEMMEICTDDLPSEILYWDKIILRKLKLKQLINI